MKKKLSEEHKKKLVKGAIKSAGAKGFYGTVINLGKNPEIKNPAALAGWLKGQANKMGVLKPEHRYTGSHKKKGKKAAKLRARAEKVLER